MADPKLSDGCSVSGFWHLTPLSCLHLWTCGPMNLIALHKQSHQHPNTSHHCCLAQQAQNQATVAWFQVFGPQPPPLLCVCERTSAVAIGATTGAADQ